MESPAKKFQNVNISYLKQADSAKLHAIRVTETGSHRRAYLPVF